MAEKEARAAWQHTGNCCFVQEDSMKSPKCSCSPASSSSKSESDTAPNNAAKSDQPPNMKWWLNMQPNYGHQKDFTYEQLNALEAELEVLSSGRFNKTAKISEVDQPKEEFSNQTIMKSKDNSLAEQPWKVSATCMKNESDTRMREVKAVLSNELQKTPKEKDLGEFWYSDDKFIDLDSFHCLDSQQQKKLSSELESHWVGAEKTESWWRTAGQDELASLVAQKSLEHIENCDLPRPQAKHFRKAPSACTECFDHDEVLASSLDQMAGKGFSSLDNYTWGSSTTDHSLHDSDKPFSTNNKDEVKNDPSKAQLLEALCHSQTRAREAEKAAQEAYNDKEHIIKLFFKQASQLFAYKQWFKLLQLENLCLQLKNKNQPISSLSPTVKKKGQRKAGKKKQKNPRSEIRKCAVAFAVGLGLASAGLLLGWTMGWLFPPL